MISQPGRAKEGPAVSFADSMAELRDDNSLAYLRLKIRARHNSCGQRESLSP